jgi:glucuronoarabinoxylan endo-1,4-beta-xylanase
VIGVEILIFFIARTVSRDGQTSRMWSSISRLRAKHCLLLGMLVMRIPFVASTRAQVVTVSWDQAYQRIDGFGASSATFTHLTESEADMFFSVDKGIGLSLLRNSINADGTTSETEIMRQALARGARIFSSPWTPPAAWKTNHSLVNGGALLAANYQDYATQLARYAAQMASQGIPIYAVSVQNEPDFAAPWGSAVWTDQQIHDFVPYLYSALQAAGVGSTKIMLPESSQWNLLPNYADATLHDPLTAADVAIVASHDYDDSKTPYPLAHSLGKDLWETEVSTLDGPFDGSMTDAMKWADNIYQFLTTVEVNAWSYWNLTAKRDGNGGLTNSSRKAAKRLYALGNFSKFVRPGYYRIDAGPIPSGLEITAFKDIASGSFAIVAINQTQSSRTVSFLLRDFVADSVTPWLTSADDNLVKQADMATLGGTSFVAKLPAHSVTTFVGSNINSPSSDSTAISTAPPILVPPDPALPQR